MSLQHSSRAPRCGVPCSFDRPTAALTLSHLLLTSPGHIDQCPVPNILFCGLGPRVIVACLHLGMGRDAGDGLWRGNKLPFTVSLSLLLLGWESARAQLQRRWVGVLVPLRVGSLYRGVWIGWINGARVAKLWN